MSICCFPNCAYLSETSRMVEVYKELVKIGEKPLMATHGGTYEFILKESGIPYTIVEPRVSHQRSLEFAAASRGERGFSGGGMYDSEDELAEHVKYEIDFFKKNTISLVLAGWTQSCAISTRAVNIPLAVTHLASLVPPAMGKMGITMLEPYDKFLNKIIPESIISALYHWALRSGMFIKPFNSVAGAFNVKPFTGFLDMWMGDLTLVTDTPEILGVTREKLEGWKPCNPRLYSRKPCLRYCGAIYAKLFGDVPEDVKEFLNTTEKKLYIALTSSSFEYVSALYSLVKEMQVKTVFVTTVHEDRLPSTSTILVKSHLPSHAVMPLVDCSLIHGGQGSTQTAIAAACPVIGFPFHGEQSMNLKLIQNAGGGFCLPLRYMRKKRLKRYITKILSDDSYKENMQRLKEGQDKWDGPACAAKILNEFKPKKLCP